MNFKNHFYAARKNKMNYGHYIWFYQMVQKLE